MKDAEKMTQNSTSLRQRHLGRTGTIAPLSAVVLMGLLGCATTDHLGSNGAIAPKEVALIKTLAQGLPLTITNKQEADIAGKTATEILKNLFSDLYNPQLPDLLVYFPKNAKPKAPILMSKEESLRVLDREAVVWVVALADPISKPDGEPGEKEECPTISVRLTAVGETRPDLALNVDQLLTAALSRKSQDKTATDAKDEDLPTHLITPDNKTICWGIQRFVLQKDSLNRMSLRAPVKTEDKVTKVEIVNDNLLMRAEKAAEKKKKPTKEPPPPQTTVFNFANARRPLYGASVAIGTNALDLINGKSCISQDGCRPSLYLFGHIRQWQYPGPATWVATPSLSWAIVGGIRILDPVLGEAVGGFRLGLEEGESKGLARFGLIVGVSYPFRTFDKSNTVKTTTTQMMLPTGGTVQTVVTENEGSRNTIRLFTGIDFAF